MNNTLRNMNEMENMMNEQDRQEEDLMNSTYNNLLNFRTGKELKE